MTPTIAEIRRTAESRLRELEPLVAEAAQLRTLLATIERGAQPLAVGEAPAPTVARLAPAPPVPTAPPAPRPARPGGRAPQGANKRLILDIVARQPGVAAPEIAAMTGLKRTVVASTISRLKRVGELEAHGGGVRLPATRASAAA